MKPISILGVVLLAVAMLCGIWIAVTNGFADATHPASSRVASDPETVASGVSASPARSSTEGSAKMVDADGSGNGDPVVSVGRAVDLPGDFDCGDTPDCGRRPGDVVDPRVAESAEEAAWMAASGFPTREQRERAKQSGSSAVLQEASSSSSVPLRVLGLETLVRETNSEAEARAAAQELDELASRGRQHYALYASVEAHLRVAALLPPAEPARRYHLEAAARAAKLAVLMGDHKAISLYWMFPADVASSLPFWVRAEADAMARLHRGDIAPGLVGFGYRSINPKPDPTIQQTYLKDLAAQSRPWGARRNCGLDPTQGRRADRPAACNAARAGMDACRAAACSGSVQVPVLSCANVPQTLAGAGDFRWAPGSAITTSSPNSAAAAWAWSTRATSRR